MAVLAVQSLCKRFGRLQVVDDVSLEIQAGQVFGLVGPNGSGKTTTISCLLGLQRPTSGKITLLGHPVEQFHKTAGRVAAVFDESPFVPGLTVRQNMEYAARLRGHSGGVAIDEALERVGMADLAERRFTKLSLGQGKRVAIASALAGRPEFLVLDEPLSGLDTLGVRSMLALVRELAGDGTTMLICSHRLREMESVVSHAGILLCGRLVRCGALDELLEHGAQTYMIRVDDHERARSLVDSVEGVQWTTAEDAAPDELVLQLDGSGQSIGALNRILIEGGCEVTGLRERELSLQQVFEQAVEEFHAEEVA